MTDQETVAAQMHRVIAALPDELTEEQLATLLAAIAVSYGMPGAVVRDVLGQLTLLLARFYENSCPCETCTTKRKGAAH